MIRSNMLHVAVAMRVEDAVVVACSGHEGVLVLGPDENDPACPICGARLCEDCKLGVIARRRLRH
jgi:hypothetical protein